MAKPVIVSPNAGMFVLSSVNKKSWRQAYVSLNGTSMYEMLRLLDQIDRRDLADFLLFGINMAYEINLPRIQFAASVVLNRKVPPSAPPDVQGAQASDAQNFLAHRSPLQIPRDPTGLLPSPLSTVQALTSDDYKAGADQMGVETAIVRAVSDVESGGRTGFGRDGRPIVRYELHIFQGRTKHAFDKTHPHLSQSYEAGKKFHDGTQANEWSMIYGVMMLRACVEHACASASWGMFQIMGFNHTAAGYTSAFDLAVDLSASPANQLQAFLTLCQNKGWDKYLAAKDWAGFAYRYNGSKYKDNHYDTHLEAAYRRHGGH
jgi:hypothetical protein